LVDYGVFAGCAPPLKVSDRESGRAVFPENIGSFAQRTLVDFDDV